MSGWVAFVFRLLDKSFRFFGLTLNLSLHDSYSICASLVSFFLSSSPPSPLAPPSFSHLSPSPHLSLLLPLPLLLSLISLPPLTSPSFSPCPSFVLSSLSLPSPLPPPPSLHSATAIVVHIQARTPGRRSYGPAAEVHTYIHTYIHTFRQN